MNIKGIFQKLFRKTKRLNPLLTNEGKLIILEGIEKERKNRGIEQELEIKGEKYILSRSRLKKIDPIKEREDSFKKLLE